MRHIGDAEESDGLGVGDDYGTSLKGTVGMTELFTNFEEQKCPIISCEIRQFPECKEPNLKSNFIVKGSSPNIKIAIKQTSLSGYNETSCIACSSLHETRIYYNFRVTQQVSCYQSIKLKDDSIPLSKFKYENDKTMKTLGLDYKSFFVNQNDDFCPINKCSLLNLFCDRGLES